MYDPTVGRWLEEDPICFEAGDPDLYRYVGNDPIDATDPSGFAATYMEGGVKKTATPDLIAGLDLATTGKPAGMPTADYLKKIGVDGITTQKKFEDSVRSNMLEIQRARLNFAFDSLTQYVNYAKYLTWVSVFAQQLQKIGPGFAARDKLAVFDGSSCWEPGDKISYTVNGREFKVKGLALKAGKTPAEGIREFFGKNGSKATIDCASFQSIVSRRALLEVLGDDLYNKTYKDVAVAGLHISNDPFPFKQVPGGFLGAIIPGMSLRFHYEGGKGGNYENENTIFIGGVLFIGHPFPKPLNPREVIQAMETATNIKGPKPDIVSSIEFTKLPK